MASDTSRPSTENGGSRPPTSRFVEGSMNDRVSAAPPVQFLGPDQLRKFERQFYAEHQADANPIRDQRRTRRDRPVSESSVAEQQEHIITHRKSTGFFGRVRDALGWNSSRNNSSNAQKHESARKHSSLQEPLQPPPPPPQRPDHLRAAKSHSEMYNLPQLSSLNVNGGPRPSRDDVLQSYNQLMATGFFQSHAIQSTRHAGPGSRGNDRRGAPPVPSMLPMPTIPGSAPCSPAAPPRTSSIDAAAQSPTSPYTSPQKLAPQKPTGPTFRSRVASHHSQRRGREPSRSEAQLPATGAPTAVPALQSMESSQSLRGRKRHRPDSEDTGRNSVEAPGGLPASSSSLAQPLKRVAKKLRKTPSSTTKDVSTPDGVLRLPPSTSVGGTAYANEKAVRMRSPSPAAPDAAIAVARRKATQQQQPPPSRTFSSSSRNEGNRLRKRGRSISLRSRTVSGAKAADGLGAPDLMDDDIYQDATATASSAPVSDDDDEDDVFRTRDALSVVPDANRGIPSVPRIPDQYHYFHKPGVPKGRYYREDLPEPRQRRQQYYQDGNASASPNVKTHTRATRHMPTRGAYAHADVENRGAQWQFGEAM
ncbi:hypothetical protein GGR53DRAFT_203413 [Hypoxylon sp. FL1150]|nr:hypothetical protein GGR53DRAFT_203413 [Hypoxylon sp. FL1150]